MEIQVHLWFYLFIFFSLLITKQVGSMHIGASPWSWLFRKMAEASKLCKHKLPMQPKQRMIWWFWGRWYSHVKTCCNCGSVFARNPKTWVRFFMKKSLTLGLIFKISRGLLPFFRKSPINMSIGLELPVAHLRPIQIWVPPSVRITIIINKIGTFFLCFLQNDKEKGMKFQNCDQKNIKPLLWYQNSIQRDWSKLL